jgi:hypothetical protein
MGCNFRYNVYKERVSGECVAVNGKKIVIKHPNMPHDSHRKIKEWKFPKSIFPVTY